MSFKSFYNKLRRYIAGKIVHKKVRLNLDEAVVTFAFDDVPESGFIYGSEIFKRYGFRSTYYVSLSFFEKGTGADRYYNPKYLHQVIKEGSELGCHTYSHIHVTRTDAKNIEKDLELNQQKINEFIPGYKFLSFAYPYGEQTITAKRVMKNRFVTARGVKGKINQGIVDLLDIKAHQLYNGFTLSDVKKLIDETIRLKGWLVLYTHEVENNPSIYGCTPEMFLYAADYCFQNKISVLTMKETFAKIERSNEL